MMLALGGCDSLASELLETRERIRLRRPGRSFLGTSSGEAMSD